MSRLKRGDEGAYEELVREHGPRMLAVALRLTRTRTDAEDVLQDAFVCVVRGVRGFAGASGLDTWLHRIVANCALMRLRTRRRRPEILLDPAASQLARRTSERAGTASPDDDPVVRREQSDCVRRAIDQLRDADRSILVLRDVEGRELKDVAHLMGIGRDTAKIRLYRARRSLRTLLVRLAPDIGGAAPPAPPAVAWPYAPADPDGEAGRAEVGP